MSSGPSQPTVKRLYAVSGNQCAFPKCTTPLVDHASGKVTGRICHIKASKPGGPRYDASQSEEERHDFNNLVLMCPIHHDVIDSDEKSYTIERLKTIKNEHQSKVDEIKEMPDSIAIGFINNMKSNSITHGSIIFNQNQMGGQVAHSITNIGVQPRQISQAAANALISELKKYPIENITISCLLNDAETFQTASMIEQILKIAGWTTSGIAQVVYTELPRNVVLIASEEKESLTCLLNWLHNIGFNPIGIIRQDYKIPEIIIGTVL